MNNNLTYGNADFAQALKGFAYAGVAYEGPLPSAPTAQIAALLAGIAPASGEGLHKRAAEAKGRISAQVVDASPSLKGKLDKALDSIDDALAENDPQALEAAITAAELIADGVEAKSKGLDAAEESPQQKMEQAWRSFDEADKKLDDAFLKLPLSEKEREHYAELQAKEEEARKRMENARTPEELAAATQAWQQATQQTHAYVEQTTDKKVKDGEISQEQGKKVTDAVGNRIEKSQHVLQAKEEVKLHQVSVSDAKEFEQLANRNEFAKLAVEDVHSPSVQLNNYAKPQSNEIAPGSFA